MTLRRVVRSLSVLLLVAMLGGIAYPIWWSHRSTAQGNALIERGTNQLTLAQPGNGSTCATTAEEAMKPIGTTPGILEIPSIGLVAPVLDGVTDSVLDVAAGHDPSTNWPGVAGESIVEAHDVSYFANLSHVKTGDKVIWLTPCGRARYQVITTAVSTPGALVYAPAGGAGLALVTCYPTNALFWTPNRFVVTTKLVSTTLVHQALPSPNISTPHLKVSIPAALVAEGLELNQNSLLMGVLQFNGVPSASFVNGPGPLLVEAQALEVFFGAEKSALQHNQLWWKALSAPNVPFRSSWPIFSEANVTMSVSGITPSSVVISSGSSSVTIANIDGVLKLANVTG